MANLNGLLPIALLTIAVAPGQRQASPPHRAGLPIRYVGEAKIIEVPIDTALLGWEPHPTRDILVEPIKPAGENDRNDGELEPQPKPVPRARPLNLEEKAIKIECFDLWLFGNLTEEKRKLWMLATLSEKIVNARKSGLSSTEEEKLILAGRGDIKRFLDRIEEMRHDFERARKDFNQGRIFLQDLQVHTIEFYLGPFRDDSLFAKTLNKIENDRRKPL